MTDKEIEFKYPIERAKGKGALMAEEYMGESVKVQGLHVLGVGEVIGIVLDGIYECLCVKFNCDEIHIVSLYKCEVIK